MNDPIGDNALSLAIKEKVLSLADPYADPIDDFGDDDVIPELGILDSGTILELILWFEEFTNISIHDDEFTLENLGTVNLMVSFYTRKKT